MQKINDGSITLIEETHEYNLHANSDQKFTSCTTFIDLFFQPFDSIGIANKLVSTNDRYYGRDPREVVADWDQVAKNGTAVHAEIENYINHGTQPKMEKSRLGARWIDRFRNPDLEIFPEVIVYSTELNLAGTVDLLVHNKRTDTYDLFDWKTSRKIEKTPFRGKTGTSAATAHLYDCNFIHYSLQLSLYRYLLEKYYGLKISKQTVLHLNSFDVVPYECDYYDEVIEEMLKDNREELIKLRDAQLTREFI